MEWRDISDFRGIPAYAQSDSTNHADSIKGEINDHNLLRSFIWTLM